MEIQSVSKPSSHPSTQAQSTSKGGFKMKSDGDGLKLSVPGEGATLEEAPDGGLRAWLIVLACAVINMCNSMVQMLLTQSGQPMKQDFDDDKVSKISEVFLDMRACTVPIAAIVSVAFGYRVVAIAGGVMIGFGFFVASFLDDTGGVGFFVSGLSGIGSAFWSLAAIVAVLEYFEKKRMRALIASLCGTLVGSLIMILVVISKYDMEWRVVFRAILSIAVIGSCAGATLVPLTLTMKDSGASFVGHVVGLLSWDLFKKPSMYLIMLIMFFDSFGRPLPTNQLLTMGSTTGQLIGLMVVVMLSPLLGYVVLFFWKNKKFLVVLLIMGVLNMFCGTLTNIMPSMKGYFSLIIISALIYSVCGGVFVTILNDALPEHFGRENIRMVQGMIGLATGIAAILSGVVNESINENGTWKAAFYAGGWMIIISGACAIASIHLIKAKEGGGNEIKSIG